MWPTIAKFMIKQVLPKLLPILLGKVKEIANKKIHAHKDETRDETAQRLIKEMNNDPAPKTNAKLPAPASDLHAAILKLDRNNSEHWAYFGKKRQRPDLDVLQKISGKRYKVKEVKDVWIQLK